MQAITIHGRIGKDAETRQAGSGSVTTFPVAVNQGFGDRQTTNWFRCNIWGKKGESVAQYLAKGGLVAVSGVLKIGEYQGKPQFDIDASDFTLPTKPQSDGRSGGSMQRHGPKQASWGDDDDGGAPF